MWEEDKKRIEEAIEAYLSEDFKSGFHDVAMYVLPDGKRYRSLLGLNVYQVLGGDSQNFLKSAAGIEFIHHASLIFDDLPCMDDSPARKGRLTAHTAFKESTAILGALYLENKGRQLLIENICEHATTIDQVKVSSSLLTNYFTELLVGQEVDLRNRSEEIVESMHKKNKLFQLSCVLPAYLLDKSKYIESLETAGKELSIAYQMFDDLRDAEGDSDITGKLSDTDGFNSVSAFGLEGARIGVVTSLEKITENFREIGVDTKPEALVKHILSVPS